MCGLQKHQVSENQSFFTMFTARALKATRSSHSMSFPMPRNALGRGLGALIRELEPKSSPEPAPIHPHPTNASGAASAPAREVAHPGPQQVDIDLIEPSPFQPRTRFREEALDELSRSIQASGIIQPLVVRPIAGRFQLIAGERRWRAAQRAGLTKVSVIVRHVSDELALEMTLVENIQREDLNAIETARAFDRLMEEFHLTQEAVAERTGKDRATVANAVRLLKLEPNIQEWIEEGKLSAPQDANIRSALEELQRHLGTKVLLREKTKARPGQLVLEYYEDAQLMGLYDRLMK